MTRPLFWLDTETSGPTVADVMFEVAIVVTDGVDLTHELATYEAVIGQWRDRALPPNLVAEFREMHTRSGLLDAIAEHGVHENDVRKAVWELVREFEGATLAGSGISFDRKFIGDAWGTMVLDPLHYRPFDVSTLREFCLRWKREVAPWQKQGGHRAMADVRDAIAETQHYMAALSAVPAGAV